MSAKKIIIIFTVLAVGLIVFYKLKSDTNFLTKKVLLK